MQDLKGSFQLMKSLNRSMVLNKIRMAGPISRADIAKETKLTPPTVSSIVKELIQAAIVIESNQGESNGGRKPTMLVINSSHFYIIGLDVGPKYLKIMMTDLTGTMIEFSKKELPIPITKHRLLDLIIHEIKTILAKHKHEEEKFIGIGVGIHGVVDVENGMSLYAPTLHLYDIPIKETLENEFKMIVKVENDARVMALGEHWFGEGKASHTVVAINIGYGFGSGIMINGKLFHGEHFIAGEIGHMTIEIGGPKCSCGNYGCLQALAAGPAIAERAIKELALGKNSLLRDLTEGDFNKIDGELIYDAARQGDLLSIDLLKQTGRYIGIGITNVIHMINPRQIIIGGGVSQARPFILDGIHDTIADRVLTNAAKHTEIILSSHGERGTAIGAVALILADLFSSSASS